MKIIKLLSFFVLFSSNLIGQVGWDVESFPYYESILDMIVESEDSLFIIAQSSRLNFDSTDYEPFSAIEFSSDGGVNWQKLIETETTSRFSAFIKRKQEIIVGGNKYMPDSSGFFLISDFGFSSIDTIENTEIKELKYFSKTDSKDAYFVYTNQSDEYQIGLLEVESKNVILEVGGYSSDLPIEQLYFFDSGVVYLRGTRDTFPDFDRPIGPGEILKSKNFGITWDSVSLKGNALSMDFFNEDDGAYYQKNSGLGRIYMTHDGAESFNIVLDSLPLIRSEYRYLKLISEHTIIGTGSTGITSSTGPFVDKFNDFQPFKIERIVDIIGLSPWFYEPVIKHDSCLYILDGLGFLKTCESSGLVNSKELDTDQKIEIYPNPASNEITLKSPTNLMGQLKIYDAIGRFRFQQKISSGNTQISINGLNNGIYFLVHEKIGAIGTFAVLK